MTIDVEITCITKDPRADKHRSIQFVGGSNSDGTRWRLALHQAIAGIEKGEYRFFTKGGGKSVWVVIATHLGHKYLKTQSDGVYPDNLLALSSCPVM